MRQPAPVRLICGLARLLVDSDSFCCGELRLIVDTEGERHVECRLGSRQGSFHTHSVSASWDVNNVAH